jgi:hypothetical protein
MKRMANWKAERLSQVQLSKELAHWTNISCLKKDFFIYLQFLFDKRLVRRYMYLYTVQEEEHIFSNAPLHEAARITYPR